MVRLFVILGVTAALALASCASTEPRERFEPNDAGEPVADAGMFGADATDGTPIGTLTGKVTAPEGSIPISNALVFVTDGLPPALPDGAGCDLCVPVNAPAYVYSGADGSFSLPVLAKGKRSLVVQKGQFRRVRPIDVIAGAQAVPAELTMLPAKNDAALGDHIPSLAIVRSDNDHIETSLAKLGLGQLDGAGKYVDGSGPFDMFDVTKPGAPTDYARLLAEPETIGKYGVVFFPCGGNSGTACNVTDTHASEALTQKTLRDYVASGGKLYVTDYSYEYVRQTWPGFVSWDGESTELGTACRSTSYDAPASADEKGLAQWLGALGDTSFSVQASWTRLTKVTPSPGLDPNGAPTTITPVVWISSTLDGTSRPATVSFESQCGRVLYSTYHTEGSRQAALLPQEKALLYVLLEVASVCAGPPIK